MRKQNAECLKVTLIRASAALTTDTDSDAVEVKGFNELSFAVSSQTITDGAYALKAKYSDNGTDYFDVPADEYVKGGQSFALTDDNKTKTYGVLVRHPFYKATIDQTGATTGGVFSIVAIQADPDFAPVS